MTNLLDERIDQHQSMDWTYGDRVVRTSFHGAPYQGIANTIVQLICRSTSGVIAPWQLIWSDERHCERPVRRKTMSIIDGPLEANRNYAKVTIQRWGSIRPPKSWL
jgi:hypothetical protein